MSRPHSGGSSWASANAPWENGWDESPARAAAAQASTAAGLLLLFVLRMWPLATAFAAPLASVEDAVHREARALDVSGGIGGGHGHHLR